MSTDTTPALDLDAIRYRLAEATPAPWTAHPDGLVWSTLIGDPVSGSTLVEDAEFIAAARQDIPALLAEVERLRAQQPPAAPAAGTDIALNAWCAQVAESHRYYEEQHPGDDRDSGLVEWVVMALGNPEQEASRDVLAVLAARHGLELTPAQAEAVAR